MYRSSLYKGAGLNTVKCNTSSRSRLPLAAFAWSTAEISRHCVHENFNLNLLNKLLKLIYLLCNGERIIFLGLKLCNFVLFLTLFSKTVLKRFFLYHSFCCLSMKFIRCLVVHNKRIQLQSCKLSA